jgi:hypothetical protein
MKKIIILMIFALSNAYGQNSILDYNLLKIDNVLLNGSKQQIISSLNIPNVPSSYYNELSADTYDLFLKSANKFYFKGNVLVDFSLNDNSFSFYSNGIKVGNSITEVQTVFPESFNKRGFKRGLGFIIINLKLLNNLESDNFIVINYNLNNLITSIHMGEY